MTEKEKLEKRILSWHRETGSVPSASPPKLYLIDRLYCPTPPSNTLTPISIPTKTNKQKKIYIYTYMGNYRSSMTLSYILIHNNTKTNKNTLILCHNLNTASFLQLFPNLLLNSKKCFVNFIDSVSECQGKTSKHRSVSLYIFYFSGISKTQLSFLKNYHKGSAE